MPYFVHSLTNEVHFHMSNSTTNRTQLRSLSASMLWCVKGYQAFGAELRQEQDSAKHGLPTSITFANPGVGQQGG